MNRQLIFWILALGFLICCSALSLFTPFFPPFAAKKGISNFVVSLIIIANPIGGIIAALILGKIITDVNIRILQPYYLFRKTDLSS